MGERSPEEMAARDQLEAEVAREREQRAIIDQALAQAVTQRDVANAAADAAAEAVGSMSAKLSTLIENNDRLRDELGAIGAQYKSHIGTLNAGIRGLERMLAQVETERDRLRATARAVLAGVDLEGNDTGRDVPVPINRLADLSFALDGSPEATDG